MVKVAEDAIEALEQQHLDGIASADLLAFFADQNVRFGEATLRKWVQLGLLPRSVRVGQKGKHKGSKGKYPIRVIRQIIRIKGLMEGDLTIEDIQRQYLFVRGDLEELQITLERVFLTLERMTRGDDITAAEGTVRLEVEKAKDLSADLVKRLERIEQQLLPSDDEAGEQVAS
ncbi:MAG: hypothetical protein AAGA56_16875 [Myxococcota bacterium]